MNSSDLKDTEQKLWQAAATGILVDLRVGEHKLDSPERWDEWGTDRSVRAAIIAALLIGDGETASVNVMGELYFLDLLTKMLRPGSEGPI
jgi:hypothetical protein